MNRLDVKLKDPQHPCDVTLVVKDGKEFQAHRDVLSQASPFFEKLLDSDMKENIEGVIRLEMIDESQMADVLEFIYTGIVQISIQENAESLIEIADYLLLSNLKALASKYLVQHTTTSNCISIYHLAEKYLCDDLIASTWKFICSNFSIVALSNDFRNFTSHDVEKWISSDELVINTEENVFEIILRWMEHAKSERSVKFAELFRHVRLTCVSRDFLVSDVVTNDLVKENKDFLESVTDSLKWIDRPIESDVPRPHPPRRALERDVIVVTACRLRSRDLDGVDSESFYDPEVTDSVLRSRLFANFYIPSTEEWYRLPPFECCPAHVVSYRGKVFVVDENISKSQCYDPEFNCWSPAPWTKLNSNLEFMKLNFKRSKHQYVMVVENQICFIVGQRPPFALWRYNIDLNSVTSLFNWVKNTYFCAVVVGRYIYVIGGMTEPDNRHFRHFSIAPPTSAAARFDTEENEWQEIAPLNEARRGCFGVSRNEEKIFIAGGIGISNRKIQWLKSCEVYNIATDEWQFIASLTVPRAFGKMELIDDTIYVLGGRMKLDRNTYRFPDDKVPVEWYDHESDMWNDKSAMPISRIFLRGAQMICRLEYCSLRIFKGVKFDDLSLIGSDH